MSDFTQIPAPTVQHDLDLFWPSAQTNYALGAAFDASGQLRYGGATVAGFWSALAGAGVNNMGADPSGVLCGQFVSDGAAHTALRSLMGFAINPPLVVGGLPPLFAYPTRYRVWRVQCVMQLQAAALVTFRTFFGLAPAAGVAPAGADSAGAAGIWVGGDGAGNWQLQIRTGIGFAFQETDPLGIAVTARTLFDFVILAATGGGPAVFQLFVNGNYSNPLIARVWGAGSVLPTYANVVNGTAFVFQAGADDPAIAAVLQVGALRCMAGQFTPSGVQL